MTMPSELVQPAVSITALFDNGNAWLDQAVLAELIEPSASLVSDHGGGRVTCQTIASGKIDDLANAGGKLDGAKTRPNRRE